MRRSVQAPSDRRVETSALFDLPLILDPVSPAEAGTEIKAEPAESEQIELPEPSEADDEAGPAVAQTPIWAARLMRRRVLAGLLDLASMLGALALMILGALMLGAGLRAADWPGYLLALGSFSFVYTVYSTLFWGQTPGMAHARLAAHTDAGGGLSCSRAVGRWLGTTLTLALFGLPTLLALRREGSLTDLLTGTRLN